MDRIPDAGGVDSTLAVLREGYNFMARRRRRLGADSFRCRLMLQDALCICGPEAARLFYGSGLFTRRGAMPPTTVRLLQDKGSVQLLDGRAHGVRKAMFLSLTTEREAAALGDAFEAAWEDEIARWRDEGAAPLHAKAQRVLCRVGCAWAGAPLASESELADRTAEIAAMIDGAGAVGPRAWRALALRERTEAWARGLIDEVRSGALDPPPGALATIARAADENGALLSRDVAAVELLNILRPTVAIANYVVFVALALHQHPDWKRRIAEDPAAAGPFAQEVRRLSPFFPFIGGRSMRSFTWRGETLRPGSWVLLDLYGTCRDPESWPDPARFDPERFDLRRPAEPRGRGYALVPQGAGDPSTDHRCPGEAPTLEVMRRAAMLLARERYETPSQDLRVQLARIPALPESRYVMRPCGAVTSA